MQHQHPHPHTQDRLNCQHEGITLYAGHRPHRPPRINTPARTRAGSSRDTGTVRASRWQGHVWSMGADGVGAHCRSMDGAGWLSTAAVLAGLQQCSSLMVMLVDRVDGRDTQHGRHGSVLLTHTHTHAIHRHTVCPHSLPIHPSTPFALHSSQPSTKALQGQTCAIWLCAHSSTQADTRHSAHSIHVHRPQLTILFLAIPPWLLLTANPPPITMAILHHYLGHLQRRRYTAIDEQQTRPKRIRHSDRSVYSHAALRLRDR